MTRALASALRLRKACAWLIVTAAVSTASLAAPGFPAGLDPAGLVTASDGARTRPPTQGNAVAPPRIGRFGGGFSTASRDVQQLLRWVLHSGDHQRHPFAVVDKLHARVYVFDAAGTLLGAAPVLLGSARGDDAVPGIGDRALSSIRPNERITPAGRFVASLDRNLADQDILWVDYDGAISLHPVRRGNPAEQRQRRLASETVDDNRISFGCINVDPAFFVSVVVPAFTGQVGIVYVLPETRAPGTIFPLHEVAD